VSVEARISIEACINKISTGSVALSRSKGQKTINIAKPYILYCRIFKGGNL
jgi:hypothetical protein